MGPAGGYGGGVYQSTPTMAYSAHFQGTVKPSPSFNPNTDCETLKKAMKGLGCDDKAIINILCYRSNAQRQQIRNTFKTMYGKDLVKELISELRGNLEDLIIALMYTPGEFDARELQNAMAGAGTTESVLIEIMATRTNAEIRDIKAAYRTMFGKDLESALVSETSGYFKRLLVSLCNGARDESAHVDPARAKKSAQDLFSAGVKRWGTDEATFNAVLCSQSYPQLQAVFEEYRKLAGHDIEQAIKQEFSGDIEDGLMAVVKSAKNPPAFFAERAYKSMVGMGTNDRALIRVIVTRCEKDMVQIKQEFQRIYGKTLESFISGDTSGKYKEGLLALVRGN
jgi:annexin A7/11